MGYRPLLDPLLYAAGLVYLVGRLALRDRVESGFVHESLNDLLLVPIFVPLMIAVVDRLGLRRRGDPPAFGEVLMPLLTVSLVFEVWLPSLERCGETCFADPSDIAWYAAGAVLSAIWWHMRHRP